MKMDLIWKTVASLALIALATPQPRCETPGIGVTPSQITTAGNWGAPVEGLQMQAAIRKSDYHVGDKVMLDASLLRIATAEPESTHLRKVAWDTNGAERQFGVQVKDQNGKDVPLTAYGRTVQPGEALRDPSLPYIGNLFHNRSILLEAGGKAVYHFWLNRIFDMSLPGDYTVTLIFDVISKDGSRSVKITSNAETVHLLPAQPTEDSADSRLAPTIFAPSKP